MPTLINTTVDAVKQSLETFVEDNPDCNNKELSSDLVSTISYELKDAIMAGAKSGLTEYIQEFESEDEVIFRNNQPFRFKTDSTKNFLSVFGEITINRRLYYHRDGGASTFQFVNQVISEDALRRNLEKTILKKPSLLPIKMQWSAQSFYITTELIFTPQIQYWES